MPPMRSFAKNNPVRIVRGICDLTQAELAGLIGCVRLTVHNLESGKLKLSATMAQRIALHTGISQHWLLNPKRKLPPICERDPQRPYTVEIFKMTRAEITDPRIEPLDVVAIEGVVAAAYRQMCDAAWQAYRTDKIVYFYYIVRELLKELENHWKDSRKLPDSSDVARLFAEFSALMEQARTAKAEKTEGRALKSGKRP